MKKSMVFFIFIAFALTLSSCQSAAVKDNDTTSEEPSSSSIVTQTEAVSKDETFDKTDTASKDETSDQTESAREDELANTTDKDVNYEEIYNNFLSGQIDAVGKNGSHDNIYYYLQTDLPEDLQKYKYAIYDMNGDDIPELIIRSRISLHIFWIYNNELALWYDTVHYCRPLNNMALLYERPGGAPTHTYYMYFVLGYHGEELYRIEFAEYYDWVFEGVDYGEKYFINDTEVTKAIYDSLSERFLHISDDKIEWKPFPY